MSAPVEKFYASYSILNIWDKGGKNKHEDITKAYFKLDRFISPAMADGSDLHEQFKDEVEKTKCLPKVFGGTPLAEPIILEKKLDAKIYDWLVLRGIPDLVTGTTLIDYKTGATEAKEYLSDAKARQFGVYKVLLALNDVYVDRADILGYNQHTKRVTRAQVWLTEAYMQDTLNWIITVAGEVHNYFSTPFPELEGKTLYQTYGFNRK